MPRKPRKRMVDPEEDIAQAARDAQCAELQIELHIAWQAGQYDPDQIIVTDDEVASDDQASEPDE